MYCLPVEVWATRCGRRCGRLLRLGSSFTTDQRLKQPSVSIRCLSTLTGPADTKQRLDDRTGARKVLVVGAGAIGLRTAWELLQRNVSVVLEAPRPPLDPSTCSMGAGGLWMPFHVNDDRVHRWAQETLNELIPICMDSSNNLAEIVPAVVLFQDHSGPSVAEFTHGRNQYPAEPGAHTVSTTLPAWTTMDDRVAFQHMTVEMLSWQNIVYRLRIPPEEELLQAGFRHAWVFRPPVVNVTQMLSYMLKQVMEHPMASMVNVETGIEFASVPQMQDRAIALGCDTVVNCTGLGAYTICQDDQLTGARGIVLQYDRSTCVRRQTIVDGPYGTNIYDAVIMDETIWGSESMPCYLIPRGDLLVVGGSYLLGDTEVSIRDEEREQLLLNASRMGIDIEKSKVVGEWTGFRPFRTQVRCEIDASYSNDGGITVVHSYGYGGSGWTLFVGAAKEVADLILGKTLV
jgi:D-amino-acid oxidase